MSFDYYSALDIFDDGDCVNDIFKILLSVNGGAIKPVPGDSCAADTTSSSTIGSSSGAESKAMTYDLTSLAGSTVGLSMEWAADALNNDGLGVVIDNVSISCTLP